jgi:hypothetical protein
VTDSARAVLGLTLAGAIVPYLPWIRGRAITRGAFAALSGSWVAYPLASRWQIWLLVAALAAMAALSPVDRRRERLPSKVP